MTDHVAPPLSSLEDEPWSANAAATENGAPRPTVPRLSNVPAWAIGAFALAALALHRRARRRRHTAATLTARRTSDGSSPKAAPRRGVLPALGFAALAAKAAWRLRPTGAVPMLAAAALSGLSRRQGGAMTATAGGSPTAPAPEAVQPEAPNAEARTRVT